MTIADEEKRYWAREREMTLGRQVMANVAILKMENKREATLAYDEHFELVVRRKQHAPQKKR